MRSGHDRKELPQDALRTQPNIVMNFFDADSLAGKDRAEVNFFVAQTALLHEVEHMAARVERLDRAIEEAVKLAPPQMREVIEALQPCERCYFPASQAARIRHKLITAEKMTGKMNKNIQLKTVMPTKQIASAQVTRGMSFSVSLLSPPSCQAKTAANRKKRPTENPAPTKKSQ
jgi:hypothetical protein